MSPRKLLSKKDEDFLKELGFRRTQSSERKMLLLDKLRMRQLDQLKMMFLRINFMENELFPHNVKDGSPSERPERVLGRNPSFVLRWKGKEKSPGI